MPAMTTGDDCVTKCECAETSLLWFISGQAWLSEGMEGDLLGGTSTGEAENPTSAVGSGTSVCGGQRQVGEVIVKEKMRHVSLF